MTFNNVQPYDWTWHDDPVFNRITVKIWALDDSSNPVLLRVQTEARCAVELPKILNGRKVTWSQHQTEQIREQLNIALAKEGYSIAGYAIQNRTNYYYHQKNQTQYMILQFLTHSAMKSAASIINRTKFFKVDTYPALLICREHDVDPTVNLMRWMNCTTTQWLNVNVLPTPLEDRYKISTLEREYIIPNRKDITPLKDGTIKYVTAPGILSFDIECYSNNHNKMPEKFLASDVAYIITCCYQKYRREETRRNIAIVYGECNNAKIHKGEVITVKSEIELVNAFGQLIVDLDPEILLGHNIFGFDYPYLDARLERFIHSEGWSKCSRIRGQKVSLINKSWESKAYGRIDTNFLDCEGRISFDLLPFFKRNAKMDNYRLDTIAKAVVGAGKFDMPAKKMFAIYKQWLEAKNLDVTDPIRIKAVDDLSEVVAYGIQDAELPIRIFDKKVIWLDILQLASVAKVTPFQIISRGLGVRGYNLVLHENFKHNIVLDERKVAIPPFDGGFVGKPKPNLYENVICLDFKSLYPSIIQAFNLCGSTYIPPDREYLYNLDHCWVFEWESEIHPDKVKHAFDINELVTTDEHDNERVAELEEDEEIREKEEELDENGEEIKKEIPKYKHRYVFYRGGPEKDQSESDKQRIEEARGILPRILEYLVASRDQVKEELKKTKDPDMKAVWGAKELALKVTANSLYGITGASEGKISCVEVALTTTYIGRTSINRVNSHIRQKYGATIVYNDTDSTMFTIPGLSGEALMAKGAEIATEISELFAPLKIEFEKAGRMLAICPKKYVFWQYDKKGIPKMKPDEKEVLVDGILTKVTQKDEQGNTKLVKDAILYKGVVATRRDNSPWLRKTYKKLLDHILERGNMQGALNIVFDAIQDLITGKVTVDDLIVTKQLRAEYKSQSATMAVFSSELAQMGNPVAPGERLPFVIVKDSQGREKIGHKMRLTDLFLADRKARANGEEVTRPKEDIDIEYYIEKGFMKPIQQLLSVAYKDDIDKAKVKNEDSNRKSLYTQIYYYNNCKYVAVLETACTMYPDSFEQQLEWLKTKAPGRTVIKKLVTKYYTKWQQADLRIGDEMIKHYLRHMRDRKELMAELVQRHELKEVARTLVR